MKKQIAVLMAAATAVTTVAPAIANAAVNEHLEVSADTVSAKIKEALGKQYKVTNNEGIGKDDYKKTDDIEDYQKSQYLVVLSVKNVIADQESNGLLKDADAAAYTQFINDSKVKKVQSGHEYIVTDAAKASSLIEKLVLNDEEVIVSIVDKGANKDGEPVEITTDKLIKKVVNDSKTEQRFADVANFLAKFVKVDESNNKKNVSNNKAGFVEELKVDGNKWTLDTPQYNNIEKLEAKLTSGAVVKLEPGDKAIDLHDVMTDKAELKVTDDKNNRLEGIEQSAYDKVTGFKNLTSEDGKRTQIDVPTGDTEVYVLKDIVTKEVKIEDVFTKDGGYTKEGADFVNKLKKAAKGDGIFNHEGTSYRADKARLSEALKGAKIVNRDGNFALEITVATVDANDTARKINLKIALTSKNAADLQVVKNDLITPVDVVVGKFTKLIGANRYETAIEVSKERFKDGEAKSVVIVGGESVIDGLSAAPLASRFDAPILLADKNGLSRNTLAEIERACDKLYNKTVYIVGGESSVPASVKKQLMEKYPNVVVERLAGANRFDTSLSVAKKLKANNAMKTSVFAVGGDGAADAMSIAPVAANKSANMVSPVLVVPKASVSKDVRDFLGQARVRNIVAVGGEASISTQALKDLKAVATNPTVDRISGSNRYDTNLAILKKYYPSDIAIKGLIVASGANDKLVDAQTSSVLASKKGYPIVLADGKLNDDQAKYLKDNKEVLNKNVNQVGGVVAADFMKAVVDSLGL
ncbi:putative cell wall binding repeat 2 [Peptostreptococcus anaerobius 653-L]|uniref:Putative cell wall binding repeat 2 n=1 Tax=Peptostreptococcus anaerobius 653-L TaxID=596329 RepID=D3MU98_9FIRM|nr:cell wall-binding repeat-containing protein [Peptostreptococcus anaerobius]EFD04292.1 putative cell wall binding repeat 2 [Peptostreptococcus anaerobius 653-L]